MSVSDYLPPTPETATAAYELESAGLQVGECGYPAQYQPLYSYSNSNVPDSMGMGMDMDMGMGYDFGSYPGFNAGYEF